MTNPLVELQKYGQSPWYDNIRRGLVLTGELYDMVERDGLLGVTSNPAIFEKALTGSTDYEPALRALVRQRAGDARALFERLAIEDIQLAADVLYPTYLRTDGRDGFVSMEVSPHLAHETEETVREARRLHAAIGRDNVMIKVPATPAGIPAIRTLVAEGVPVNVTLLFSVDVYERVVRAYWDGLHELVARGGDPARVASVASFFVSRIDAAVDRRLAALAERAGDEATRRRLEALMGKAAIANARLAYERFRRLHEEPRWKALEEKGGRKQRLLWASTSTKSPKYPKTLYVEELIGPDTVNTMPAETWRAFREHGRARPSLVEDAEAKTAEARRILGELEAFGLSLAEVTDRLLDEGVRKFVDAFDRLLAAVEGKRQGLLACCIAKQETRLGPIERAVDETLEDWRETGKLRRLWRGDPTVWTGDGESRWLGWLHVVESEKERADELAALADEVRAAGFRHVLLLGMGGSSLCPEVMSLVFGSSEGFPALRVLDSTVPAQIRRIAAGLDPATTLYLVASKSGTTTEPLAFHAYFRELARERLGAERAGAHWIAITDPGTPLETLAREEGFRCVLHGEPTIGGRYSALSDFGMAPSALIGLDVAELLERAEIMVQSCASAVPPEVNPGVVLGAILGAAAQAGRDKLTFVASPRLRPLGAWLEQLVAESTGKGGKGIVPVDGEELGDPDTYGDDRLFVELRCRDERDAERERLLETLARAGHPVVRIELDDPREIGQEFFRWEMATAVAGSVLGINPFDQPDVEASKVKTRELTERYERTGELAEPEPLLAEGPLRLFADPANAAALAGTAGSKDAAGLLRAHLDRLAPGDYFAVNAYLDRSEANERRLGAIREAVRAARRVATTVGFGPRFLHSTGQLHKGGPPSGVFLQLTADTPDDLPIPGRRTSFGLLQRFQAEGDFEVLAERGRRLLRVHLGPDVAEGLSALAALVREVVRS